MMKMMTIEQFVKEILDPLSYQSPLSGDIQWARVAGFVPVTNDILSPDLEEVRTKLRDSEPGLRLRDTLAGGPGFDVGYTLQRVGPSGPITGLTYGWAYRF